MDLTDGWSYIRSGVSATASPPTPLPAQYSPALPGGTTRFGMERGGTRALSATPTPDLTHLLVVPSHRHPRPQIPGIDGRETRGGDRRDAALEERRDHAVWRSRRSDDLCGAVEDPPSTMRTARLQSVTRCPPAAS